MNSTNLVSKAFAALMVAAVAVFVSCMAVVAQPSLAFADGPTYTFELEGSGDIPETLHEGDTFTVVGELSCNEKDSFRMYAISTTVRYDSSMFELVESSAYENTVVSTSEQSGSWAGYTDVVCNVMSSTTSGQKWEGPVDFVTLTFRVKQSGASTIMVRRANISNSTGRGSYAVNCSDLNVNVAGSSDAPAATGPAISESSSVSAGTTAGVEAPEADPNTEYDDEAELAAWEEARASEELSQTTQPTTLESTEIDNSALTEKADAQANTINPLIIIAAVAVVAVLLIITIIVLIKKSRVSDRETIEEIAQGKHRGR